MKTNERTLSVVMNELLEKGYKDQFELEEDGLKSVSNQKVFDPKDLLIVEKFKFDGMTSPSDESQLFAIEVKNGPKGTLVTSRQTDNLSVLKRIPMAE